MKRKAQYMEDAEIEKLSTPYEKFLEEENRQLRKEYEERIASLEEENTIGRNILETERRLNSVMPCNLSEGTEGWKHVNGVIQTQKSIIYHLVSSHKEELSRVLTETRKLKEKNELYRSVLRKTTTDHQRRSTLLANRNKTINALSKELKILKEINNGEARPDVAIPGKNSKLTPGSPDDGRSPICEQGCKVGECVCWDIFDIFD